MVVVAAAVAPAAREADLVLPAPRRTHRRLQHQRMLPVLHVERVPEALVAAVVQALVVVPARDQPRPGRPPTRFQRLRRPPRLAACSAQCA